MLDPHLCQADFPVSSIQVILQDSHRFNIILVWLTINNLLGILQNEAMFPVSLPRGQSTWREGLPTPCLQYITT